MVQHDETTSSGTKGRWFRGGRDWRGIAPWLSLVAILVLTLGMWLALATALQSPGERIKGALERAATDVGQLPPAPSAPALAHLRHDFRGQDVTIDATTWPSLSITLHNLDARTCRDAAIRAGHIVGLVVVRLEGYRTLSACRPSNDMTWRIWP
jgi:hypothetical protein